MRNLLGADGSVDRRLIAVLLDEELRSAEDGQAAGYSRARTSRSKLRALGLGLPDRRRPARMPVAGHGRDRRPDIVHETGDS